MTEKLLRSTESLAKRILMSEWPIFAFVEGKETDRAIYGNIFEANQELQGGRYEFLLAQDVFLNDVSHGGKTQLHRLFDHFESRGELRQKNNDGFRNMVFFIDRDYDDICGSCRRSPHVLYTQNADAESEILLNGDLAGAVRNTFSLDLASLNQLVPDVPGEVKILANNWRDWITAAIISMHFGVHANMNHMDVSKFNKGNYGELDQQIVDSTMNILVSKIPHPNPDALISPLKQKIDTIYRSGSQNSLLKGEWICRYLQNLITNRAKAQNISINTSAGAYSMVLSFLGSLNYNGNWCFRYHAFLNNVLNVKSKSKGYEFVRRVNNILHREKFF